MTALPTKPSSGPFPAVVADRDQLRLGVGALGDRRERAHPRRLDLRAAHHLDGDAGDLARPGGERLRRQRVRRRCCRGRRTRLAASPTTRPRSTAALDVVVGGDDQRVRGAVVGRLGLERRVAVGGEQRPSTSAPATASSTLCGSSQQSTRAPSSCARPSASSPRPARAPRRTSSRDPQPTRIQRRPAACVCVQRAKARTAPRRTRRARRARRPRGRAERPFPSKIPTTTVSAPVSSGLSVVARMSMRRRLSSALCPRPSSSAPPARPSASWAVDSPASTPPSSAASRSRPRCERAGVEPEQVEHVVMGQVLQAGSGPDPVAPGADQAPGSRRRSPPRPSTRSARPACARSGSSTRRSAPATSTSPSAAGMESMSQAPYLLPAGALRLPHGRRQGARRDGPRRADEPVQRQADVRRGDRGRRRARDDPRRPRPLGAALARARDRRDRRRPPARGDRHRDRQGPQGRHRRRGRRGAAPRLVARVARQAARASSARRARTPPATRRASTTAPARSCSPSDEWAERQRQGDPRRDRRPGAGRRRLPLPRPHARERGEEAARPRSACRPRTSTCGRSTRRSPRSR